MTSDQQLPECPFEIEVFQGRVDLTEVITSFHSARGGRRPRGFVLLFAPSSPLVIRDRPPPAFVAASHIHENALIPLHRSLQFARHHRDTLRKGIRHA